MNLYGDEWDVERESSEGVPSRFMHVGHRVGSTLLGGTLMEVGAGYRGPYHLHHGNEEMVVVLRGRVTVRDEAGERDLGEGDTAFFALGRDGLHAIENRSEAPARFLLLSSKVHPDVTERPEEGVVGVFAGDVPTMGRDAPFEAFFPRDAAVG
jgi:uncharacterized cupin superfamily protein